MIKIDKQLFSDLLVSSFPSANRGNCEFGEYVELEPLNALKLSEISGATFVDNSAAGSFSLKGLSRILQSAQEFKFVTGVFDGTERLNCASNLVNTRPYLVDGMKKVLIYECDHFLEVPSLLKLIREKSIPGEYLVALIDKSKKDYGMEYALEYHFALKLWNFGYFAETQSPLGHSLGTPDVVGIKSNLIQNCCSKGFNQIDVLFQKYFPHIHDNSSSDHLNSARTVVGEAKVGAAIPNVQLSKYINTGFFESAYALLPESTGSNIHKVGVFSLNEDLKFHLGISKKFAGEGVEEYIRWFKKYVTLYTISSLSEFEFKRILGGDVLSKKDFENRLVSVASDMDVWF